MAKSTSKIPENSREEIRTKKSLDEFLINSFFISNLNNTEVQEMKRSGNSLREIILADYVKNVFGTNAVKSLNGKSDKVLYLSNLYLKSNKISSSDKPSPRTQQMAFANEALKSLLKYNSSKELIDGNLSIKDRKSVLFFDYLFSQLSPQRKSDLRKVEDIEKKLMGAAELYVVQVAEGKLDEFNTGLESFLTDIGTSFGIKSIKSYNKLLSDAPSDNYKRADRRFSEKCKRKDQLIKKINTSMAAEINKKNNSLKKEFQNMNEMYLKIELVTLPSNSNMKKLNELTGKLDEHILFYKTVGFKKDEIMRAEKLKGRIADLFGDYELYKSNNVKYNRDYEILENSLARARKDAVSGKFDLVAKQLSRVSEKPMSIPEGRYSKYIVAGNLDQVRRDYSKINYFLGAEMNSINSKISELKAEFDKKRRRFFSRSFALPRIMNKIKSYRKSRLNISECQSYLRTFGENYNLR